MINHYDSYIHKILSHASEVMVNQGGKVHSHTPMNLMSKFTG